jgi:hypothetical protein
MPHCPARAAVQIDASQLGARHKVAASLSGEHRVSDSTLDQTVAYLAAKLRAT